MSSGSGFPGLRDLRPGREPAPKINNPMKEIHQQDRDFIGFCIDRLGITTSPNIKISDDHSRSRELKTMGYYSPSENLIWVLRGSRIPADWYRTLAHELVHWRQREQAESLDGSDGSPTENQANSLAGSLLREFGRANDTIYISRSANEPAIPQEAPLPEV